MRMSKHVTRIRFPDPYSFQNETDEESVVYAYAQAAGKDKNQEDSIRFFSDECIALSDGVTGVPHSNIASTFACETAVWAYKHLRTHRTYRMDRKLFMKRIFRTSNMAIWQKQKEEAYAAGLTTTLCVLMIGAKTLWLGNAGDAQAWLIRDGSLNKLTRDKQVFSNIPHKALGRKRLGLVPEFLATPFSGGDVVLLATDGAADYLTVPDILTAAAGADRSADDMKHAAESLLASAETSGSDGDRTVVMVKRLER